MKAISYSLFGYGNKKPAHTCFEFNTYLRGLMVNVRFNRVLYPNWINVLHIDYHSYNSPFRKIFDWLQAKGFIVIDIHADNEPLCRAMLWRVKTVFDYKHPDWIYTHVLCRDIDSIATYREAQAVQQWINEDKTIHCITDSISHNIPMMGGMVGFRPAHFSARMGLNTFDALMALSNGIDFSRKGSDQDFLNRKVYPKCAESATEHFVLGMVHNLPEINGRHYSIADIKIDVPEIFKCTNDCAGHIGAAGYYEPPALKFLNEVDPYGEEYEEIEKQFPNIFFWRG